MTKKSFTALFTFLSTIINILFTAIIIAALTAISTVIMNKVIGVTTGQIYLVVWMFCFLGGLVLGIFAFGKLSAKIIDKYNLAEKLDPKVIGKHLPSGKKNASYAQVEKEEQEKPKTVMPDSVKEEEDPWENNS